MNRYEDQEREARAEAFREDLERQYQDDPDYWAWYEERRAAAKQAENES